MTGRRFEFSWGSVQLFADRLRLGTYTDKVIGFQLVLGPDDPQVADLSQADVLINLAKKDRAAYERAAAAFNAIMDQHDAAEALKLERRRCRHRHVTASPPSALQNGHAVTSPSRHA